MEHGRSDSLPMPTFVGVGAKKSATTWLSVCLRHHPDVFMSSPKELHFFSDDDTWAKGVEWYAEHFRANEGHAVAGEISPSYLTNPSAPERMRQTLGSDIKILVSLRDPIERFISEYKHRMRERSPADRVRRLDLQAFEAATARKPRMLSNGAYYEGLVRYMDAFGCENVCVVLKEDIDDDPHAVLRQVFAFLGVDPTFVPPNVDKKTSPGIVPRFAFLESFRQWAYRTLNRIDSRIVVAVRRMRIAELYRALNHDRSEESFRVEPDVLEALAEHYADDVANVSALLDRPLHAWRSYGRERNADTSKG